MNTDNSSVTEDPDGLLAALRPTRGALDPQWSNSTLQTILSEPHRVRRWRSRRRVVAGGIVVALLAGSGVAYAQGVRPPWVSSSAQSMTGESDLNMRQFVDLELPDGSRFAAWRGNKGDAMCDASADNWDGGQESYSGGVGCNTDASAAEKNRLIRFVWAAAKMADPTGDKAPTHWYPVLYGFISDQRISEVRVSGVLRANGEPVDLRLEVDPTDRSFSTVLPGSSDNPWSKEQMESVDSGLSIEFLDKTGAVVTRSPVV